MMYAFFKKLNQSNNTLPPPLFAASMSAVWNTVFGQGLGTKLSESPITENTMVGLVFPSSDVLVVEVTPWEISFQVYSIMFAST